MWPLTQHYLNLTSSPAIMWPRQCKHATLLTQPSNAFLLHRPGFNLPPQILHSSATEKTDNKETRVTFTRNDIRNSKRRNKQNNRRENDNPLPRPPAPPNREESDAKDHHVPEVPQPDSGVTTPVMMIHNWSQNTVRQETSNSNNVYEDGLTVVEKKRTEIYLMPNPFKGHLS